MKNDRKNRNILLVEDKPAALRLTQEVFRENKMRNNLYVARDGVEAMGFLRQKGEYADVPRPDLILLDLNLPRRDGREVLAEIKSDDELKRIPVVVLSVSESEEDILQCYNRQANCYITKPIHLEQFIKTIRAIEDFWLNIVMLPE